MFGVNAHSHCLEQPVSQNTWQDGMNPQTTFVYPDNRYISTVALSPDGETFVITSLDSGRETVEFQTSSGRLLSNPLQRLSITSPEKSLGKFTFSGDNRFLITSSGIRDNIGRSIATYDTQFYGCDGIAASYNGDVIALKNFHQVAIYNRDGKFQRNLDIPSELLKYDLGRLTLSPDGSFIALATRLSELGFREEVHLFRVDDGQKICTLLETFSSISGLQICKDNVILVGYHNGPQGVISFWKSDFSLETKLELNQSVFSLSSSFDGGTVVFESNNSEIHVLLNKKSHYILNNHDHIGHLYISQNGQTIAATSPHTFQLWKI